MKEMRRELRSQGQTSNRLHFIHLESVVHMTFDLYNECLGQDYGADKTPAFSSLSSSYGTSNLKRSCGLLMVHGSVRGTILHL